MERWEKQHEEKTTQVDERMRRRSNQTEKQPTTRHQADDARDGVSERQDAHEEDGAARTQG